MLDVDAFNKHVLEQLSSEVSRPEEPPLALVRDCTYVRAGKVCYLDTDSMAENLVDRIRGLSPLPRSLRPATASFFWGAVRRTWLRCFFHGEGDMSRNLIFSARPLRLL